MTKDHSSQSARLSDGHWTTIVCKILTSPACQLTAWEIAPELPLQETGAATAFCANKQGTQKKFACVTRFIKCKRKEMMFEVLPTTESCAAFCQNKLVLAFLPDHGSAETLQLSCIFYALFGFGILGARRKWTHRSWAAYAVLFPAHAILLSLAKDLWSLCMAVLSSETLQCILGALIVWLILWLGSLQR